MICISSHSQTILIESLLSFAFESITIIAFVHLNINYKNARRIQLDSTIGAKTMHSKILGKIQPSSHA
jgi:hypothetical protein